MDEDEYNMEELINEDAKVQEYNDYEPDDVVDEEEGVLLEHSTTTTSILPPAVTSTLIPPTRPAAFEKKMKHKVDDLKENEFECDVYATTTQRRTSTSLVQGTVRIT
jgi:hypothetical protein